MALTDVGLCTRALIRIGAHPIASFQDGTAAAEIAGALYPASRDALLSSYHWSFATAQNVLTRLETTPLADYKYAYALPNDFLRAVSAGQGARGRGVNFRIARNVLHTDVQDVVLTYIFRPDEAEFPAFFDTALIARMAAELCIPLTENTSRSDSMFRIAEQEYAKARQIDAQQDTPNRIERFPLTDIRN